MPRSEIPDPPERGSLRWELIRREKFIWKAGDIRLVRPTEGRKEAPREDDGNPNPGSG